MHNICSKRYVYPTIVGKVIKIFAALVEKTRRFFRLQWLNSEFGFFWTLLIKVKFFENASLGPNFFALQPGEVLISLPSLLIKLSSDLSHSR